MRLERSIALLGVAGFAAALVSSGCARKEAPAPAAAAEAPAPPPADGGKIPVTTSSEAAKAEFLQGRDLFEKLRITDSIAHFQKAVSLDPNFALAELSLANSAPTGTEFFDHLHKAVGLADKVSKGERLMILAAQAGVNNDAQTQKEDLLQLVAAYPNDERAHFNLGGFYFGQQDFGQAIEHYKRATEINPNYSTAFNLLGYSYRQNGDFADAEKAFQAYIALIPADPNPYDSYAELLLRMGRYDDSIVQYRKALEIDPNFINAHQGIAMDLLYAGKSGDAAAELQTMTRKARTDGERRTALFARTVLHVDGGDMAKALADLDEQYALGQKTNDVGAMAFDLATRGQILLEMGKPDQARAEFERGLALIEGSSLSPEIKANARLVSHYNLTRVALAKNDFAAAEREAAEYRKGVESSKNPAQARNAHELDGIVALAEKKYDEAIAQLQQANPQNPYNLYRLCQAYRGKGDAAKAGEYCDRAARTNTLPQMNLAFVRSRAKTGGGQKG